LINEMNIPLRTACRNTCRTPRKERRAA
jgi:hypothetical protein